MLPIHEFILWNNCPNNCKFCWQKREKQQTHEEQLESIKLIYNAVKDLTDTHILFVGGEIFAEKNIIINYQIDEKILGGLIIKYDDIIIDASVQNKIKKLHSILKGNI